MRTHVHARDAADVLLRDAQSRTYRLPPGFGGFAGALRLHTGDSGTLVVRSPDDVQVSLPTASEDLASWVRQELTGLLRHRWPMRYDHRDGRWAKRLGPEDGHPQGRLVRLLDDPLNSSYRVLDGEVTQIERELPDSRFAIVVHTRLAVGDGRTVPTVFHVVHWSPDTAPEPGRIVRVDAYSDRYVPVGDVWLPASRTVVTADDHGLTVRAVRVTDHELVGAERPTGRPADGEADGRGGPSRVRP